jgi:hypothetical protein
MTEKVRKVVYIEDEEDMISLVRLILERKGFEIKGRDWWSRRFSYYSRI